MSRQVIASSPQSVDNETNADHGELLQAVAASNGTLWWVLLQRTVDSMRPGGPFHTRTHNWAVVACLHVGQAFLYGSVTAKM